MSSHRGVGSFMIELHSKIRPILGELPDFRASYIPRYTARLNITEDFGPWAQYPEDQLVSDIQELYANYLNIDVPSAEIKPEQILVTRGAIEAIDCLVRAVCEPKSGSVGFFTPTFPAFEHMAFLHGLKVESLPLKGEYLAELPENFHELYSCDLVFLCSPNNPTGMKLANEDLEKWLMGYKGLTVVDETYCEFGNGDGSDSAIKYLSKFPNLVILRSLSKTWGLAGLRCGFAIGNARLVDGLTRVLHRFAMSSPVQKYVKAAFLEFKRVKSFRYEIIRRRSGLLGALALKPCVEKVFPSSSNSILLVLSEHKKIVPILLQEKCLFVDSNPFVRNSIKMTIGTDLENQRMLKILRSWQVKESS